MVKLKFRDVLRMTSNEAWEIVEQHESVSVELDDGVLTTPSEDFFINRICWQMFRELPKQFPSSVHYSISEFEHITVRTHLDICGRVLKDYVMWEEDQGNIPDLEPIKRIVYEITNELDNEIDNRMDAQTTDICFDHLKELYDDEDVKRANDYVQNTNAITHDDIQDVYKAVNVATLDKPQYKENPAAIAARCGVIKMTQLSMVLGPIGYCTDINSKIIPHPIRVGFFRGMKKLDDMLYESRNASIAALFNIVIMPLAEYANRRYQLPAEYVKNKVSGDCGASSGEILVLDKSHLKSLAGFSLTDGPHGRKLRYLSTADTELIGKKIYIRDPNYCRMQPRDSICTSCLGLMHYSFPDNSVIGHIAATQVGSNTSTVVLQRKHQNLTSQAADIEMDETFEKYFKVNQLDHGYRFAKGFDYSNWNLILTQDAALYLKEIQSDYGDQLVPSTTTRIEIIQLRSKDGLDTVEMPIGFGQRAGFLTKEALEFYRQKGWSFIDGNLYQLDLEGWNNVSDIVQVPQIEFTPPDLISSMTEFIFSGSKDDSKKTFKTPLLINCTSVDEAYATFYDLIRDHLKGIHSVHLMLIILAMSVQDAKNYDYRLPYPRENGRTVKLDDLMRYRSLSGAMAYEEQNRLFLDPITYLVHRRPSHIYDSILMG